MPENWLKLNTFISTAPNKEKIVFVSWAVFSCQFLLENLITKLAKKLFLVYYLNHKLNTMKLLIVESPAKAKTISKYLDGKYEVRASVGHIRDLPKSNKKAIDIPGGFIPHYEDRKSVV